jgi:hypothetical protein
MSEYQIKSTLNQNQYKNNLAIVYLFLPFFIKFPLSFQLIKYHTLISILTFFCQDRVFIIFV